MLPGRYDDRSHSRPAMDRRGRQARHLPLLPAALLAVALSARAAIAPAVVKPAGARPHGTATSGAPAKLNTVTIQAALKRRLVMRQVSRAASPVVTARWDYPSGVSIGQLADYVALTGLAQIQMDTRPAARSILTLFEDGKAGSHGLSAWDRALLYALYHRSQDTGRDGLPQVSRIRESMVSQLLSSGRKR
jgi:hypothetical protein